MTWTPLMQQLLAFAAQPSERLSQLDPTHLSSADRLRQQQCFQHALLCTELYNEQAFSFLKVRKRRR